MKKVDVYLLKNFTYILLLANLIALIFGGGKIFLWANVIAFGLCLLMFILIRLTVRRYASDFGKDREAVKDLLGKYIEDDKRGKVSFYLYLKKRFAAQTAATIKANNAEPGI